MRASASTKSCSGRGSVGKVAKVSAKCSAKKKAKWKVVDGKVEVSPGDYRIEDLEAMLKAIQCLGKRCATRNGKTAK